MHAYGVNPWLSIPSNRETKSKALKYTLARVFTSNFLFSVEVIDQIAENILARGVPVRGLTFDEVNSHTLKIKGRVASYYHKQLIFHQAQDAVSGGLNICVADVAVG
jgi:hypothetical protein